MPIYEFVCRACGTNFEKLSRMSDTLPPPCPQCGSAETVKKISGCVSRTGGSGGKTSEAAPAPHRSGFT